MRAIRLKGKIPRDTEVESRQRKNSITTQKVKQFCHSGIFIVIFKAFSMYNYTLT